MRGAWRGGALAALGWAVLLCCSPAVLAQDALPERVAVTIDYVSVDGLYFPIGADQGVTRGDTVSVFRDATAREPMGRLVFTSVTRRRSVAQPVDPSLRLDRGAVVYIPLAPAEALAGASGAAAARPAPATLPTAPARGIDSGPRVSGRLAMDLDLRETHTSWTGDLSGDTRRRFATPTTRLSFNVSELPGGMSARVSLRASYRYDELGFGPPPMSVRAYELSATKRFDVVPVEITLGRFSDPYESYSAYWDGALLRVGGRTGPGLGVVAGFEPSLYNEGVSTAVPKVTGFVDYAVRGSGWRYDTDASVHLVRPGDVDRLSYLGWSQRLSLGPLSFNQRLRVDGGLDGRSWSLGELRLRTSLEVTGPLRVRGTYGRSRWAGYPPSGLLDLAGLQAPDREEILAGVDLHGPRARVSVDGGLTRQDGFDDGLSLSGRGSLRLGGAQLLLSGQRWTRGDARSLGVAPGLSLGAGSMRWRIGYRFYRTEATYGNLSSHAAQAQVDAELSRSLRVTLQGERQWGRNLSGTGLRLGVWRSF